MEEKIGTSCFLFALSSSLETFGRRKNETKTKQNEENFQKNYYRQLKIWRYNTISLSDWFVSKKKKRGKQMYVVKLTFTLAYRCTSMSSTHGYWDNMFSCSVSPF